MLFRSWLRRADGTSWIASGSGTIFAEPGMVFAPPADKARFDAIDAEIVVVKSNQTVLNNGIKKTSFAIAAIPHTEDVT